jgi:hypothetical protein
MTMTTLDPVDLHWVHTMIQNSPVLAEMKHRIVLWHDLVVVEVVGSHFEARAWRHAIDGRIFPSTVDSQHVRRQHIASGRVQVLVVEYPAGYPADLLPEWVIA